MWGRILGGEEKPEDLWVGVEGKNHIINPQTEGGGGRGRRKEAKEIHPKTDQESPDEDEEKTPALPWAETGAKSHL